MSASDTRYVEPSLQDVSRTALQSLVSGYMREIIDRPDQDNRLLAELCLKYYDRPVYMLILNNQDLKLSLLDPATKHCRLSSNNAQFIPKNEEKELHFGGEQRVSFCHKSDANIGVRNMQELIQKNDNCKYNVIFKAGGDSKKYWHDCGLILYPKDIRPDAFDAYYYKLADLPWELNRKHDLIYSNKYGLIYMASQTNMSNAHSRDQVGDIYSLDINANQWSTEKLPKPLRFGYLWPSNCCLVNNNETEVFIVNGSVDNVDSHGNNEKSLVKQTSIYNLETKEYKLLADNADANVFCGITYHHNSKRVYIGGGFCVSSASVYYYDFHKNAYIRNAFQTPKSKYTDPTLYLNEQGSILHIANFETLNGYICHEWIDLRANEDWKFVYWTENRSVMHFKLWTKQQKYSMSVIDFQ